MADLQSMHHTEYDEEDRGRKRRRINCAEGGSREKKDEKKEDEEARGELSSSPEGSSVH